MEKESRKNCVVFTLTRRERIMGASRTGKRHLAMCWLCVALCCYTISFEKANEEQEEAAMNSNRMRPVCVHRLITAEKPRPHRQKERTWRKRNRMNEKGNTARNWTLKRNEFKWIEVTEQQSKNTTATGNRRTKKTRAQAEKDVSRFRRMDEGVWEGRKRQWIAINLLWMV